MFSFLTWLFSLFGPSGTQRAINEAIAESAKAEAAQAAKDEAEALAAKAQRVSAAAEKAEQATQANPNRRRDRDDGR